MFQVSKDGQNWTTLYTHVDDCSLNEPGYDSLFHRIHPIFILWLQICDETPGGDVEQFLHRSSYLQKSSDLKSMPNPDGLLIGDVLKSNRVFLQVDGHVASGPVQRGEAGLETH